MITKEKILIELKAKRDSLILENRKIIEELESVQREILRQSRWMLSQRLVKKTVSGRVVSSQTSKRSTGRKKK